jgi:hypothetical protein
MRFPPGDPPLLCGRAPFRVRSQSNLPLDCTPYGPDCPEGGVERDPHQVSHAMGEATPR